MFFFKLDITLVCANDPLAMTRIFASGDIVVLPVAGGVGAATAKGVAMPTGVSAANIDRSVAHRETATTT